jgi:hypothetical protein
LSTLSAAEAVRMAEYPTAVAVLRAMRTARASASARRGVWFLVFMSYPPLKGYGVVTIIQHIWQLVNIFSAKLVDIFLILWYYGHAGGETPSDSERK